MLKIFSKGNLKHYEFEANLIHSDFKEIKNMDFSSIVCDPPYGIASTTGGESIGELMKRCLDVFQSAMKKKQRGYIPVNQSFKRGSHDRFKCGRF